MGFWIFLIILFGCGGIVGGVQSVYAVPDGQQDDALITTDENTTNNDTDTSNSENDSADSSKTESSSKSKTNMCKKSMGSLGWIVCPIMNKVSEAVDWLYDKIEEIIVINPVEAKDGSPVYEIWKYCLSVANVLFIVFLLVVIYSQITGLGINNYGIKKALPKLIVMAILVNLSFLICSLAVDVSNIVGNGLRGVFESVEQTALSNMGEAVPATATVSMVDVYTSMAGGVVLAVGVGAIAFETGAIWMLIPTVLGAIVAVATGLITIALRQAVVILLVMIAPLAFAANILPNTESWFQKWKKLFIQMLVFYPMFSLLFGASSLAGFAIIMSAKNGFWLLLGIAVQIFPLFFSWKLMKMSGTFLGDINAKLNALVSKPVASSRAWAEQKKQQTSLNRIVNGKTPMSHLMRFMDNRKALEAKHMENLQTIRKGKTDLFVQQKLAGSEIGDMEAKQKVASNYTRAEKEARNYKLMTQNATAYTEHVMSRYGSYYNTNARDIQLNKQSQRAFIDYGRANYQKEIDDENDVSFLVNKYLEANKRDVNNNPVDQTAFNRYIRSVTGPDGEERLVAKVIAQAAKAESKQRADTGIMYAKYGHNGYNKQEFRNFMLGYKVNDDGWAVDINGKRLTDEHGKYVEVVQGDALTKAPEKLVLYDKRDAKGLYYDFKDQDGNVVARVHRGVGTDGILHDDGPFLKETIGNYDIPIGDPINNVYGILSGVKAGDIVTPQGPNEIGLARYSTTIGRAMSSYKENAAWSGAMFNTGISNRQIKNSSQYAIWVLDSIKKTLKPGAFNIQNPASVEYIRTILNPDNWDKIFTEQELIDAININNELVGGEDWDVDEDGRINYTPVDEPNYEQRMNTLKRKLLFPAMKKILPSFDRLRTNSTVDNQKPGTADEQFEFLRMVKEKWENNPEINFDPTLVDQDLQWEARQFRLRKHDKDGRLIYNRKGNPAANNSYQPPENLLNLMEEAYERSMLSSDLIRELFDIMRSRGEYGRALERFDELCNENPDATLDEIRDWFADLDCLVKYD